MNERTPQQVVARNQALAGATGLTEFELESILRQKPLAGRKFVFMCPACGHRLRTNLLSAGRIGRCPACQTEQTVPRLRRSIFSRASV